MSDASRNGEVETVRALAMTGLDINSRNYDSRTTLHVAAAEGRTSIVTLLCELGADLNLKDRWGNTPLQSAVSGRHREAAAELRSQGMCVLYFCVEKRGLEGRGMKG
ncbi:ankyrin repeat-containing domain protein [Pavlovales sp. CCMP2436]|nr:ankyrin repeat-containing domain protein [Pavlovales sp. CCMP2436]